MECQESRESTTTAWLRQELDAESFPARCASVRARSKRNPSNWFEGGVFGVFRLIGVGIRWRSASEADDRREYRENARELGGRDVEPKMDSGGGTSRLGAGAIASYAQSNLP